MKVKRWNQLLWTLIAVNVVGTIIKAIYYSSQGLPEFILTGTVFYFLIVLGLIMSALGGGWGWLLFSLFFNIGLAVDGPLVIGANIWMSIPTAVLSFVITIAMLIMRKGMTVEEKNAIRRPEKKKLRQIVLIVIVVVYAATMVYMFVFSGNGRQTLPITKYYGLCEQAGTVEKLEYTSYVYDDAGNPGEVIPKYCYVYLPYGYDPEQSYNILYLSHGGGGAADNWLIEVERNKNMVDHMIANGECKPLIIVTPTFYQFNDMEHSGQYAVNLTKIFQYELRNDLIPAVESKYATYAEGDISIESLVVSRDHRAFAGLSMGSMTTWSSALCGNLDLFSWFGPYSAEGDTQAVLDTVNDPANDIYPIHYIYNANGTADGAYIRHKQMYLQLLEDDYFVEGENIEFTTLQLYMHDWPAWTIDLYNTLHIFFTE